MFHSQRKLDSLQILLGKIAYMTQTNFLTLQSLNFFSGSATNQVIVVTGAGRGIGREIALAFAWLGARIVIAEISDQGLETERLIREGGGKATFIRTDVSDPAQVAQLAKQTQELVGSVDILVNNAILCPVASVLEMAVALWDKVMAVNLRGTFLTCKAFLPALLSKNKGVIINMVSTDAMTHLSAYIASKQGLVGFSQSLAAEIGESDVHVIAFAPGFIDTPGLRGAAEGLAPHLNLTTEQFMNLSLHPAYPGSMPVEDAAAATIFLALKASKEYHGELTNGYDILEQAGYLSSTTTPPSEVSLILPPSLVTISFEKAAQAGLQLEKVITETEEEFGKMPVFIRPLARSGFKNKSGQSIQEWIRTIHGLSELLILAAKGDPSSTGSLNTNSAQWLSQLTHLEDYYRGVPAETARFTKDTEFLKEIEKKTAERIETIQEIKTVFTNRTEPGK
jgi:NAD(P)-dependent dehydrogenase (short-subunit alcohol dehydrogenase family)